MEQQLDRLETLLLNVLDQLVAVTSQLKFINEPVGRELMLSQLAYRRKAALDRHRHEWERSGRQHTVRQSGLEDAVDEIDNWSLPVLYET